MARCRGGLIEIGHPVKAENPLDFCFVNEPPRHKVCLEPFQNANRKVTCREYLEFLSDDAYMYPELWLSDGWEMVRQAGWEAPCIGNAIPAMRRAGASSL
jgi:formylglycine-generating enzyme required for sulfatase activity